jgi:NhaA family Na+:H+ antiporter
MWFFVLRSGVHATLAGVALALTIPLETTLPQDEPSPLERLEHFLNPWVAFFIVPLFGFANAGVSLHDLSIAALTSPVPLGIAAGLLLGKQIGVFVSAWLTIRLGLADKPERASFAQLYGVSAICGVGFTMSLFIGLLAFPDSAELQEAVKVGVLSGSVLSMATGTVILLATGSRKNSEC